MKLEFINFAEIFDPNKVITNHEPLTKDKKFSPDGLFSERIFGKHNNETETLSYHCDCNKYIGRFLEGKECEECHTKVRLNTSLIENTGWINLDKYYIINPVFYHLMCRLAGGSKKLIKMISYERKIDRDGNILDEDKGKYDNIGMVEFKNLFFDEILDWLHSQSKNREKDDIYNLIINNKEKVFTNVIPVYDTTLRPASVVMNDKPVFKFDEINNAFNFIIKYNNIINKSKKFDLVVLPTLFKIQQQANLIFIKIIENLAGKTGFIRSKILGNRLNISSRSVMTPLSPGHDICDLELPYLSFVELYSFYLINMLCSLKNISMIQASKIILAAQADFNEEVYELCTELVNKTKYGLLAIGIRNPTIARGSVLCHKIVGVKKDFSNLTVSVHNSILSLIAGDYDGDVYNIFPIINNDLKLLFSEVFSPENMLISNNDGRFNEKLALDKDQVLGLYQCNS